jgi:hypothetical protein
VHVTRLLPLIGLLLATGDRAQPPVIAHSTWQAAAPVGITPAGAAVRRNNGVGDSLVFGNHVVHVMATARDSVNGRAIDLARLELATAGGTGTAVREPRTVTEGRAFNWRGIHVVVVAVYGPGELGAGLVALELAAVASLPAAVADADSAGGAAMRIRIPHQITHVTLHHTGDARPLRVEEDPAQRLRNLQAWGARDRNWWDVPYHFLLDLEGDIYEGRDWRFMGETNTTYDPSGHFLVSIIGNYDQQEPTVAQLASIAKLMAWAIRTNGLSIDDIGGHYHYANTGCPGKYLKRYLEDGTLRRMVEAQLAAH